MLIILNKVNNERQIYDYDDIDRMFDEKRNEFYRKLYIEKNNNNSIELYCGCSNELIPLTVSHRLETYYLKNLKENGPKHNEGCNFHGEYSSYGKAWCLNTKIGEIDAPIEGNPYNIKKKREKDCDEKRDNNESNDKQYKNKRGRSLNTFNGFVRHWLLDSWKIISKNHSKNNQKPPAIDELLKYYIRHSRRINLEKKLKLRDLLINSSDAKRQAKAIVLNKKKYPIIIGKYKSGKKLEGGKNLITIKYIDNHLLVREANCICDAQNYGIGLNKQTQ